MEYSGLVIAFIGGLGLFIYGMNVMAVGLQKSAGSKMKKLLAALTRTKLMGVLVGTVVTGIIQSSSATTVMVVGFVNAGLMNLSQSVGVIMGANIGTTVTSWIVASEEWAKYLKPTTLAPLAVGIGAAMVLFSSTQKIRQIGEIIVGFGILFVGMNTMTVAVSPLQDSDIFKSMVVVLGQNPLLGILTGAVVTGIIQSSSASVGILQSLAAVGLVPFGAAVYIIMGQNIGTCVTALLSSIGASRTAKSAAYIHLLFNIFGSIVFSSIAIFYLTVINKTIGAQPITLTEISAVHTSFNIATVILLFPFSNGLVFLAQKIAAVDKTVPDESQLIHLDDRVLDTPAFALENCIKEIVRMGEMAKDNLILSTGALAEKDLEKARKVMAREKTIDALEIHITNYLAKLANLDLNEEQSATVTSLFHTVSDVERVGDHGENIAELAIYMVEENLNFSEYARDEFDQIVDTTIKCFGMSIEALETGKKDTAKMVVVLEERIDTYERSFRNNHIKRLQNNECNAGVGVVFLDTLTNLERISDHALNIAEMVLGLR